MQLYKVAETGQVKQIITFLFDFNRVAVSRLLSGLSWPVFKLKFHTYRHVLETYAIWYKYHMVLYLK
ncbi:hypothetical protein C0J52_01353 [Blattella germanica]|nr:hypothetical protein C0J52_01353 [Blattella germanica]